MLHDDDPELLKWLREHPTDQAKVGPSLGLPATKGGSSSSTDPAPHVSAPELPAPLSPGELTVFDGAQEDDFTDVVSLLISHGVDNVRCTKTRVFCGKGE